jgi:NAD(P)-dependent dehydrogenase (short-subunit alcohol dehydrogenase family)
MTRLSNKVAVVTGAGSGIGRASALPLAENGARVAITDLNAEELAATASAIEAAGAPVVQVAGAPGGAHRE